MVTIKDIARISGYAVSTVSRALNNHPDVSPEARAHIDQIVKEYGYIPNTNARQLKKQDTRNIGIVVKGTFNTLFSAIIEEMQAYIRRAGYTVITLYIDEVDTNEVEQALQLCHDRKLLGLLFLGGNEENFISTFPKIDIPSVLVTASAKSLAFHNLSSVSTDDILAAKCAVDYLIENGHTNVGVVGGSLQKSDISRMRYEGAKKSFEEHGLAFDVDKCYASARYSYNSAYRAMGRLLDENPTVTAVFAMSDVMAIGAIRAMRDKGLRVPEDISIVGFDGIELAEYYNPKLATIRQSQELLAKRGVEILIDRLENITEYALHEITPFSLEKGESVVKHT